jgi:hypothetical protein
MSAAAAPLSKQQRMSPDMQVGRDTMPHSPIPPLSSELAQRIRLVRRDMGDLLFHFTRGAEPVWREVHGRKFNMAETASHVLTKILNTGLRGSSAWTYGINTVCFTEAPIGEFNAVFALNSIANDASLRPRYEPYGVAVSKAWLFSKGGRPVIYDHPAAQAGYPHDLLFRFCPYDPTAGVDYTWEREWRINVEHLELEPKQTLVIVPTAEEAFEFVYQYAREEPDVDGSGSAVGSYHHPKWLAVSLDMLGT